MADVRTATITVGQLQAFIEMNDLPPDATVEVFIDERAYYVEGADFVPVMDIAASIGIGMTSQLKLWLTVNPADLADELPQP